MPDSIEAVERRIDQLRGELRRAAGTGDRLRARALRAELRRAEHEWDDALAQIEEATDPAVRDDAAPAPDAARRVVPLPRVNGTLLSIREQVHHALTLLTVPAAPKLIIAVHEAFFPGELVAARLTSLRRDEERSFKVAPYGRPFYLLPALTADLLAPARGLLAISTWALETRVVGPLSARVDFLVSAMKVAARVATLPDEVPAARRLLWRFAAGIPGAKGTPDSVVEAAQAELDVHTEADRGHRAAAADRARERLDDAERLFGARLHKLRSTVK